MCAYMGAEHDDLPDAVKTEVKAFTDLNVTWIAKVLSAATADGDPALLKQQALAIFAAIGGAQLAARSQGSVAVYDAIIAGYRSAGLIPS